jgi:hypothetical protein
MKLPARPVRPARSRPSISARSGTPDNGRWSPTTRLSSVTGEAGRPAGLWLGVRRSTTRFGLGRGRIPVLEASYLQDLDAEGLEPGEKSVQGGLILNRTVQDGFHRLHRGG